MTYRSRRPTIAVCGSGRTDAPTVLLDRAEAVGRALAQAGCALVCGGLGGVMEAAARGAQRAVIGGASGGPVIGLVPGEDRDAANRWCDVVVPTGLGVARNVLVVRTADGVVLVGGGSGTLSEAALAWQLGRPIVALAGSGGWSDRLAGERIDGRRSDEIHAASGPAEAVSMLLQLLPERS